MRIAARGGKQVAVVALARRLAGITSAIDVRDGRWRLLKETDLHVPDTVEELLSARIDRLPEPAKRALQIGSVVGREFPWNLLERVAGMTEMELIAALSALKDAELVYERGVHPLTVYVFKHIFTQDVAYEGLLGAERRRLHRQVGEAILRQAPEAADEEAGILAHHFGRSGDAGKALEYLIRSGERSERVYANAEALRAFSEANGILEGLSLTAETGAQRIALALRLGHLHELLGHYAESLAVATRAIELVEASGDQVALDRLENHIGEIRYSMGDIDGAIACLQRALQRAERRGDDRSMSVSHRHLGTVHFSSGNLETAVDCFRHSLAISEAAQNQSETATSRILLSNAHCRRGDLGEAEAQARRALDLCDAIGNDRRGAWARIMLAQTLTYQGRRDELATLRERALGVFERMGDFRGRAWVLAMASLAQAEIGRDFERAIELAQQSRVMPLQSGGFQHELSANLARLGEYWIRLGRPREALQHCQESLAISLKMANKLEYGHAYMVLAEVYASEEYRDWDGAGRYLEESLKAFGAVGAQLDVARAYLAGARISLMKGDGSAPELARKAREIATTRGARPVVEEAEDILALA